MSEKENEAIKLLKNIAENAVEYDYLNWEEIDAVKALLNLIQKQDKIIDMAMELIARKVGSRIEICPDMNCCKETEENRTCKQCAIEYFKKEAEEC